MSTLRPRSDSPAARGWRMPGEWQPHVGCWMAWPCRDATFPNGLDAARTAYAAVARAIAAFEPVTMVVGDGQAVTASLMCGPGVSILVADTSDSWLRDNGPSFVIDGKGGVAGVHWGFNAWGGNYPDCAPDAALAATLLEKLGLPRFAAPLVMEGGSFHVDGEGTLLTTEECLLNPNRNPGLSRAEIERHLADHLGIDTVIWLPRGYEQDETDGHIDEIATFIRPGVVLTMITDDPQDANYPVFQDNLRRLQLARDSRGRALEVVTLQTPRRRDENGVRLTLSYTNFYPANGGVVLPAFEDPMDAVAHGLFRRLYPDREIVQVPALDIVRGGGGIHCITQQQPVG